MESKLADKLEEYWLKPKSIPIALILLVIGYVVLISAVSAWDGITLNTKAYCIIGAIFVFTWGVYDVVCLICYRLPKAPKGYLSVLFCIEAESEKLLSAAKSKLVSNFNSSLDGNSKVRFRALCVSKKRVVKYNLQEDKDCLSLLQRTGSTLLVNVRYVTDDTDNSEIFELKINYGVRHPYFNETAQKALSYDLSQLGSPIRSQRFEKRNTIDVFNFTTQALVFACQYIIGFVTLLTGDGENSLVLLQQAKDTAKRNDGKGFDVKSLVQVVDDRMFAAHNQVATKCLKAFQEDYSMKHLCDMEEALEAANRIHPDTYSYNLGKAYVLVMLHQDGTAARKCIEKCKQSNQNQDWKYSEAFLCAYAERTPGMVMSKYNKAFMVPYDNPLELADYIELVIEREPDKLMLHLAVGLIYNHMGAIKLARQHLSFFLEKTEKIDRRTQEKIDHLLDIAKCDVRCSKQCSSCKNIEVA